MRPHPFLYWLSDLMFPSPPPTPPYPSIPSHLPSPPLTSLSLLPSSLLQSLPSLFPLLPSPSLPLIPSFPLPTFLPPPLPSITLCSPRCFGSRECHVAASVSKGQNIAPGKHEFTFNCSPLSRHEIFYSSLALLCTPSLPPVKKMS